MKPERWQQLEKLFQTALERKPEERTAFLDEACAGDQKLRKEVEELIAANERAGSFIEKPALEVEARSLACDQGDSIAELTVGKTIGHYRVIDLLGSGGMGEVYLTQDTVLGRTVALKLLPASLTKDNDRLHRFGQEARAASALNHPNIITIYEIGEADSVPYIATEFIDGETLRERIATVQSHMIGDGNGNTAAPQRLSEVLDIAIQTADALAAAHEAGIVHRDIKPENIMTRRRDGYVKVLDFGLAKLTEGLGTEVVTEAPTRLRLQTSAGLVMGTVTYMSPEQTRGEKVDARTDIWSLGVVLYELVAGCAPFERPTPSEVIALILEREPMPLTRYVREVPAELERIVTKALTKDKQERYQTAKDLLADLRRLRQRLELEAEIERTAQPAKNGEAKSVATSIEAPAGAATIATGDAAIAQSTSSAAYLVEGIKLHKRGALTILAVLVAAAGLSYFAYFAYSRYEVSKLSSRAGAIRSVAVLPFANQTNNADSEYLSEGISESLINNLSQLPDVKVIARSSSFKYKGNEVDLQEVAHALGVEAILTGRVEQRGDNLVISVELMDARDKRHVWGEQYNRRVSDLLAVQSEISREIAEELRLHLTTGEQQQIAKREGVNPQAYELLLRGRFIARKGGPENRKRAIEYYQQSISVDPTYALAYAELSASYSILYSGGVLDPKEYRPKAKAAVQRALELDDSLADAHYALAKLKEEAWEWAAAEREYKRAIELNPNLAPAHIFYSFHLMDMGRYDEAIAEAKRSRELDPLSLRANMQIGNALGAARRYDEAIESLKRTLEMDQNFAAAHFLLGYIYVAMGRYAEGIAEYEMIKASGSDPSRQIYLGAAYARGGQHAKAREILKRLETTKEYVSPTELSILYAALGEREKAFASLEKAYASHDLQLGTIRTDASYDSLREDPRFKDLMRRVGLPL